MITQGHSEHQRLFRALDEASLWNRPASNKIISSQRERDIRFGIDRVRHIFSFLHIRKQYIRCDIADTVCQAFILDIKQKLAILYVKDLENLQIGDLYNFEMEFYYFNTKYQFDVFVSEIHGNHICIYIPDELQSTKRRKTERVLVDDFFIRFTLAYPPFPVLPFKNLLPLEPRVYGSFSSIIEELEKDEPKMSFIYAEICNQIKKMGFTPDLQIYPSGSQAKPSGIMEETMHKEKKTFFVADSREIESYFLPPEGERLTNLHRVYEDLEKESPGKGRSYCQEIQKQDTENSIRSYAYTPLIVFSSVIGYIKIFSTTFDQKTISEEQLENLDLLVQFLSYGIKKSIITQKYYYQINARVRNIGRGGLFFEIEDKKVLDYLISHIYLKITLEFEGYVLNVKARIMQYYAMEEAGNYGVGVQFYKEDPDASMILENLIYEQKRSDLKANLL